MHDKHVRATALLQYIQAVTSDSFKLHVSDTDANKILIMHLQIIHIYLLLYCVGSMIQLVFVHGSW